jgi:prepilin-type N-terminal cleavage/methylation domain-containing protein
MIPMTLPLIPSRRPSRSRRPAGAARRPLAARAGFSLVEIMVSITLLAIALTSLAGLSFTAARHQREVTAATYRAAFMSEQVNRLTTIPFGALPAEPVDTFVTTGPLPHRRQITVTALTPTVSQVRIIILPTRPYLRADTATFERSL